MPNHPSDDLELIFRIARLNRPAQLKRKALVHLRAFLVQHHALSAQATAEMVHMMRCGCDDCLACTGDALGAFAGIEADLRSLTQLDDTLTSICEHFEHPPTEHFDTAEEFLRERMLNVVAGDATPSTIESLERLLHHSTDTDATP
jgi:hypothetical protein